MSRTKRATPLAMAAVACAAIACGTSSDPPVLVTFSAACLHYADHVTGSECAGPTLPPAEVERVRPRWAQQCENILAQPGTRITANLLDTCLTALEAGACWWATSPEACNLAGLLPGDASCNRLDWQCASGSCSPISNPDGGTAANACGACLPSESPGDACDPLQEKNVCAGQTLCETDPATGIASCTNVTLGGQGTACQVDTDCEAGLACDVRTFACSPPAAEGGPCNQTTGCAYPLVCVGTFLTGTSCQPRNQVGGRCTADLYCAPGLGCSIPSGASEGVCGNIQWAGAGESCDGDLVRCLVGSCPSAGTTATCPAIIPDGDPCVEGDFLHVCDSAATCLQGRCTMPTGVACP